MERTLSEYLSEIPEFRRQNKNFAHPLQDILLLSICALFHGAEDFEEMADFGRAKEGFLRSFLSLPNGIPSHDTIRRVFLRLDSQIFNEKFMAWVQDLLCDTSLPYQQVSIDGKTLRGTRTGLHLVHAVASELGLCLGQVKTADKSNEITAIPNLLEMLNLQGCIVSIDSMGTQKAIAKQIVAKQGDYFLALKDNHPTLFEQVKQQFRLEKADEVFETQDFSGSHNAVVSYQVSVCHHFKWVENVSEWEQLKTLVRVKTQSDNRAWQERYYLCSVANLSAIQAMNLARGHWSVENKLHWQLDVTLKEDSKRNRKDYSAQNLSLLRKILLNVAQTQEPKLSKKRIIKQMIWNPDYCLQMLAKIIAI